MSQSRAGWGSLALPYPYLGRTGILHPPHAMSSKESPRVFGAVAITLVLGSAFTCGVGFQQIRSPSSSLKHRLVFGFLAFSWDEYSFLGRNNLFWQILFAAKQLQHWSHNCSNRSLTGCEGYFKLLWKGFQQPWKADVDPRLGFFLPPPEKCLECLEKTTPLLLSHDQNPFQAPSR